MRNLGYKRISPNSSTDPKTDGLEADSQPLLYAAAISRIAILENVKVIPPENKIDFFDQSLTSNGRAMVKRSDVAFTDDRIDIASQGSQRCVISLLHCTRNASQPSASASLAFCFSVFRF